MDGLTHKGTPTLESCNGGGALLTVKCVMGCMGVWGTGIFQDDTACDLRESYRDYLGDGLNGAEAKARILKEFGGDLADPRDGGVIWLALAAVQWKLGRLDEETRGHALRVIDSGVDLERWNSENKDYAKRKVALEKLRIQITSPQPAEKKVTRRKLCESLWNEGDLFGYRLLDGKLILFWVIGHHTDKGGKYPLCHLLDWVGEEVPDKELARRLEVKPSRSDQKHTIKKIMIVGLRPKWMKRLVSVNVNLDPPPMKVTSSVVHIKYMDQFLKNWFLIG